jgi:hypothetical protein
LPQEFLYGASHRCAQNSSRLLFKALPRFERCTVGENAFDTAVEKVRFDYSWKCNAVLVLQILVLQSVISSPLSARKLSHWRYVTSLLTALSEYFLQTTVRKVKKSPLYGLIFDLSTDRASREIMLVYVTF